MKHPWRWILGGLSAVLLVTVMAAAAVLVFVLPQEIGTLTVNGEVIELHGADAGHWAIATAGLLAAAIAALLVVPLALLLGIGLPALLVCLAFVACTLVAGVTLAALLSPLLLLVAAGWWLWKRRKRPTTIGP